MNEDFDNQCLECDTFINNETNFMNSGLCDNCFYNISEVIPDQYDWFENREQI